MNKPKYVVTARNRLTGQREVISKPCSREKAEDLRLRYIYERRNIKRPYTYPKVEIAPTDGQC